MRWVEDGGQGWGEARKPPHHHHHQAGGAVSQRRASVSPSLTAAAAGDGGLGGAELPAVPAGLPHRLPGRCPGEAHRLAPGEQQDLSLPPRRLPGLWMLHENTRGATRPPKYLQAFSSYGKTEPTLTPEPPGPPVCGVLRSRLAPSLPLRRAGMLESGGARTTPSRAAAGGDLSAPVGVTA